MAKKATAKPKAEPKAKRVLKNSLHIPGLGTFEAGAEVTAEMKAKFDEFQKKAFDADDARNKKADKLPTLDDLSK